jgi:TolB-like protein
MRPAANPHADPPDPHSVRTQVERMTASTVFASSPQLAAFLVFVVEAVLRGRGERIKGYTIGVEVLRRDINFDPQLDPIVRVEATRLRRAIERYYAGPGAADPVVIDLPRGGYVPRFAWRADGLAAKEPAPPLEPEIVLMPGNGMPTLRVAPFVVVGTADTRAIVTETLGSKIAEAFALFDVVNITVAAPPNHRAAAAITPAPPAPANRSNYRLDGTIEYRGNETVDVRFKLIDESDSTVIWSRSFERLSGETGDAEDKIILELATSVVQPFGVISANDRAKHLSSDMLDPRYRGLIEAGDALRSFDPEAHVRARDRLEQLTALDPNFANGFSFLSVFYVREYQTGFGARAGDLPPLDRALRAGRRGVELRPQSARAYQLLSTALYYRQEKEASFAAAEKAVELNKYDLIVLSDYGGRLVCAGEVDRGMQFLEQAVGVGAVTTSWNHFYLFVGHYIRGEMAEARYHAGQLTGDTYVFGQLARALIASLDDDVEETRRAVRAILALQPAWREDPRREIGRTIIAPEIADRLARDLVATGYLN